MNIKIKKKRLKNVTIVLSCLDNSKCYNFKKEPDNLISEMLYNFHFHGLQFEKW